MFKLSKSGFNFVVDSVLLLLTVGVLGAASIVQIVFPSASRASGWTLWGLDYDAWSRVQFGFLALFVLVILLHVILHWPWVCGFIVSRVNKYTGAKRPMPPDGVRTLYGVVFLIVVLLIFAVLVGAAQFMVHAPPRPPK